MVMNGGDKLQALSWRRRFFARVYKSGGIGVPWGPCTTVNLLGSDGHGLALAVLELSAKLLFTQGISQPRLCYNSVFDGSR